MENTKNYRPLSGLEAARLMILLGLLLILATVGLSFALIAANDNLFTAPVTTLEIFGTQISLAPGMVFLTGVAAGALVLLGLIMVFGGLGRSARRRSTARHQLRDSRQENEELRRQRDAEADDHTTRETALDSEGITSRR